MSPTRTRKKVLEAAKRLDYRPSLIPRIMLTHRSNLVAIVVGGLYNPFYSAVLEQFTVKFQASGHQVLLVHVASDHALDAVIPKLASYRVDAIVSALAILSPTRGADAGQVQDPGDLLQHRREERMGHAGVMRQYRGGPLDRRAVRRQRAHVRSASSPGPSPATPAPDG